MGTTSRPIAFLDFLPAVFRRQGEGDELLRRFLIAFEALFEELEDAIEGSLPELLRLRVVAVADAVVTVAPFRVGPVRVPAGTVVTATVAPRQTTLAAPIPADARGVTTVEVSDPGVAAGLRPGQILEVQRDSGAGPIRLLEVVGVAGATVTVASFDAGPVALPVGTPVTVRTGPLRTTLKEPIPADKETSPPVEQIELADADVAAALGTGDQLTVHAGGLPDLFHFLTTPPPQLRHSPATEFAHLAALAAWLDLPLRPEKPVDFNRRWFGEAVRLHPRRATLPGLDALLRAWLEGDLLVVDRQTDTPPLILTDLIRRSNEVLAAFQLGVTATLGVDTVLSEGPPHLFIVDLPTAPEVAALRHPDGLEVLHRAARALLDREKPAWTLYELRIRAHGMELAPDGEVPDEGFDHPYAQIGRTTLLWDRPWVFEGRE